MKDYLKDLIDHTYGLGDIELIKVTGTATETTINAVAENKSVIISGKFKNPIADFIGTFGMPNLGKLKTIIGFDEYDERGLIQIKKQQVHLAARLLDEKISSNDISYLLSFLNNVIYRRSIRIAEKKINQKNIIKQIPNFSILVMGSGGRMESFLQPDQDNGIIYESSKTEDPKKVDLYFEELAKEFTKSFLILETFVFSAPRSTT